jgi:NAD+ synthetase
MASLKVALAQINTTVGDLRGNTRKVLHAMEQAAREGAGLLVFPELTLSGYPPEDLLLRRWFVEDCASCLRRIAEESTDTAVVVGLPYPDGGSVRNVAAVCQHGAVSAIYAKVELPNYGVFDEKRYFAAGGDLVAVQANGLTAALTICEDVWIEGGPVEQAVRAAGADLTVNLSASPFHAGKHEERRRILERFAAATGSVVAYTNLDVTCFTLPIGLVYSAYVELLAEQLGSGEGGIAFENLQARIRGNLLMALSNRFGWLVLTTGNKSETAAGYCTLYGDMAGGFAVLKDVPKTLVYKLSGHVNAKAGREMIPRSVFDRAPSAELRPNQTDQDTLPPYDVLDRVIEAYVEQDLAPDRIASSGLDSGLVADIIGLIDRNEYKRRQAPPGVKIIPRAFGKNRRMPITSRYAAGAVERARG